MEELALKCKTPRDWEQLRCWVHAYKEFLGHELELRVLVQDMHKMMDLGLDITHAQAAVQAREVEREMSAIKMRRASDEIGRRERARWCRWWR